MTARDLALARAAVEQTDDTYGRARILARALNLEGDRNVEDLLRAALKAENQSGYEEGYEEGSVMEGRIPL